MATKMTFEEFGQLVRNDEKKAYWRLLVMLLALFTAIGQAGKVTGLWWYFHTCMVPFWFVLSVLQWRCWRAYNTIRRGIEGGVIKEAEGDRHGG